VTLQRRASPFNMRLRVSTRGASQAKTTMGFNPSSSNNIWHACVWQTSLPKADKLVWPLYCHARERWHPDSSGFRIESGMTCVEAPRLRSCRTRILKPPDFFILSLPKWAAIIILNVYPNWSRLRCHRIKSP